jgi:Putative zinc-finger
VTLNLGAGSLSRLPHDEFLELCAVSTSGELSGEEQKRLQEHLAICPSCRDAMRQFEVLLSETIPALAPEPENLASDPSWSQEQAEAALFERLTLEEEVGTERWTSRRDSPVKPVANVPLSVSQATWRNVWTLYAAGIILCIALGVSAYRVGTHHGQESASPATVQNNANQLGLLRQLSDAAHDREILRSQIEGRDKAIASLRRGLQLQADEMGRMKVVQSQTVEQLHDEQASKQDLLQERSDLAKKLDTVQTQAQVLESKLGILESESSKDKQRAIALDAQLSDLTHLLHDRETTVDQQQELLAHDRDIRDLMGARDLYIAEVYDVERTGETKKPYGRVFYTKGKSLVFYAYDLDQQKGIKTASTFQAWGRRGPDRQQALNLGVFYEDSASKKRWVLKFDDSKALEQIDAVFVTVEPDGGSHKPSTKPLLFAYLRIDPNHP